MPISEAIRQFAEEPDYEQPAPWPPGKRFRGPTFTLGLSPDPNHASLSRVRTTEGELDALIEGVRVILREHGFLSCAWFVGPSCRPANLGQLLVDRGFEHGRLPTFEARYTAMTLVAPPVPHDPGPTIEARPVRSLDEYLHAFRIGLQALGETEDAIAKWVAAARIGWNHENGVARMSHVAFVDGEVAGLGLASYGPSAVLLGGAAVMPNYRGRGVYRALVASRWEAAVKLGKPALAVHAGSMSRPILERCGFEEVCKIDLLIDPTLADPRPQTLR
jgi:GNAT superfamily N-acetyltransferase